MSNLNKKEKVMLGIIFLILYSVFVFSEDLKFMDYGILDYSSSKTSPIVLKRSLDKITEKIKLPRTIIKINNEEANIVTGQRGTKIYLSKDSFQDHAGNKVQGDVSLRIIEAVDAIDFFLAGIDLVYYDQGKFNLFESAGMLYLSAFQGKRPLRLASGKTLLVKFPMVVEGDRFRLYQNDQYGLWRDIGPVANNYANQNNSRNSNNNQDPEINSNSQDYDGAMRIGNRSFSINGLGWWNLDYPQPDIACLKGHAVWSNNSKPSNIRVVSIGIDYNGSFWRYYGKDGTFRINVPQSKTIHLMLIDEQGGLGLRKNIYTPDKTGYDQVPEPKGNYCHNIGTITIKTVDRQILANKDKMQQFLGLSSKQYQVQY